jgi:hypothetical protein
MSESFGSPRAPSGAASPSAGRAVLLPSRRAVLLASPLAVCVRAGRVLAQSAPRVSRAFNGIPEEQILEQLRAGRVLSRRPVGSTSVNYACDLAGEIDMAFKPRSATHGEAYLSEIAAFRLNRLLGLNRVPPACSRVMPRGSLRLPTSSPVTAERDGSVRGAAIYWCPVLRDSRIDQERERGRWTEQLRHRGRLADADRARAEEISTLVAFDVLTGNWDRWSGSNVPMDASGHLIYLDNNGGFSEPFGERMMAGVLRHLRPIQRFSRSLIERARALTEAAVRAEMALDGDPAHPPLNPTQIASLLRRRDALIAHVDEQVRRNGAESALCFA